jgi:hypothetical protein
MEGGAGVVGRALVAQPQMRFSFDMLADGSDDPRLADARLARQEHRLPLAVLDLLPAIEQQGDLLLAPDQQREPGRARLEPALDRSRPGDPPHRHRVGEALQHLRPEILEFERAADQPPRRGSDQDRVGLRQRLQPGRQVGRLADDRLLLGGAFADKVADDHHSGGDADPRRQGLADGRAEPPDRLDGGQAGQHRAFGVVLVRPRVAEVGQHPVAHVLGDVALEAGDLAGDRVLVGADHLAHLLRVEPAGERRRADQVDEHDRQLPPFRAGRRPRLWRSIGRDRAAAAAAVGLAPQGGDGVEQPAAVAERGHAEFLEVLPRQPGQQPGIDVVLAERRFVSLQAQAPQPSRDVHLSSPLGAFRPPCQPQPTSDRDRRRRATSRTEDARRCRPLWGGSRIVRASTCFTRLAAPSGGRFGSPATTSGIRSGRSRFSRAAR